MTELHGVLLDLDGTLIDQEGAAVDALTAWLPTLGVPLTADVVALWFELSERHLQAWRERRIDFPEQRRRRLRDFLPAVGVAFDDDDEYLDGVFAGYLHWYERSWRAFDDVDDALAIIGRAGLRVAVLTNGTQEQQNDKLARVGLTGRVGPVYTAEELDAAKPAPEAYLVACRRWGMDPRAVLNVGDRYDLDVLAARAAGLRAVHLDRRGEHATDEHHRITSLRELGAFFRG